MKTKTFLYSIYFRDGEWIGVDFYTPFDEIILSCIIREKDFQEILDLVVDISWKWDKLKEKIDKIGFLPKKILDLKIIKFIAEKSNVDTKKLVAEIQEYRKKYLA